MEVKTVYFEKQGKENTDATLRIAKQRAQELGITNIVVATTKGDTAVKAMDALPGLRVIVVSHVAGSREPNVQPLTEENRRTVESKGGVIVTAAHAFAGVTRALREKHNMYLLGEIVADTLRIFGAGMKVTCEITLMATDAGMISTGEDVIAIGGTHGGADTALLLTAQNSHRFFDLKVREVLCKPRL